MGWYNAATGERRKAVGVTLVLKQWKDEGKATRLIPYRVGGTGGRGFRWVGEQCPAEEVTHYDIKKRMCQKREERETGKQNAGF
jgi:hypothetical protein